MTNQNSGNSLPLELYGVPEPRTPYVVSSIESTPEAQEKRGWNLEVNGEPVDNVTSMRLAHPAMGVDLEYGARPEGYDGFVIHEPGGGGAVTIPYMIHPEEGKIYVGLVREFRGPAGGFVLNVPRGFLDPGETHDVAAAREVKEETGLDVLTDRMISLSSGLNPNSTFFDTSRETQDGDPEGAHIYGLPVKPEEVEAVMAEDGSKYYQFRPDIREQADGDKPAERIMGSMFVPMDVARRSADMYTRAAAGDLMMHLLGEGTLRLAGVERPH